MEVTIASHNSNYLSFAELKRGRTEVKKNVKFSKNSTKEMMTITKNELVRITGKPNFEEKKSMPFKDMIGSGPILTKLQGEKKHALQRYDRKGPYFEGIPREEISVPDSNLPGMLDDLLEKGVIQLPEPKRPKEVGRTANPKYCRYHRMISHPLEKCITIKECIMQLAKEEKIILNWDDVVEANHISS